jgi:hypothetical protein
MISSEQGDQWIDNRTRRAQDEDFCDAMAQAWRLGLEKPPMIGVDTRPGTRNPRHIPQRQPQLPAQSVGGELIKIT